MKWRPQVVMVMRAIIELPRGHSILGCWEASPTQEVRFRKLVWGCSNPRSLAVSSSKDLANLSSRRTNPVGDGGGLKLDFLSVNKCISPRTPQASLV